MQDMLNNYAVKFLKEEFDLELDIPIVVNGRFKSTLGRFKYFSFKGLLVADEIQISKNLLMFYSKETILSVLKHELIHYALFKLGKPFRDSDRTFIQACKSRCVALTQTIKKQGEYFIYKCPHCGEEHEIHRKIKSDEKLKCNCKNWIYSDNLLKTIKKYEEE